MKKLFAFMLTLALCTGLLTGCGSSEKSPNNGDNTENPAKTETSVKTEDSQKAEDSQKEGADSSASDSAAVTVPGEIYSTGEFQALVPEGWTAFPIADAFSDDNTVDTSCVNIIKGGESDMDVFYKPYIRLDYYGPDTDMLKPSSEWYENVEDIDTMQLGEYSWSGFTGTDGYGKMAVLWAEKEDFQYQATICLEIEGKSIGVEDADIQAILASVAPSDAVPGENLANGTAGSASEDAEVTDAYSWWNTYWYGWWAVQNGTGIYKELSDHNLVWDAFAEIQTYDRFGHMTVWDTETSMSFALISGDISFEAGGKNGVMALQHGTFFYGNTWLEEWPVVPMDMEEGELRVDPENSSVSHFENMIEITGHYQSPENPEDGFDYYFYLRPWGTLWEDVRSGDTAGCLYEDMMPLYHDDWYISLLNLGYEKPTASFGEGIDVINDYLANQGSNTNTPGTAGGALDPADKENADGKVDLETLKRCLPWCKKETSYSTTYDEVAAQFGVHGLAIESLFEGKSIYRWLADDDNYIQITFDMQQDGTETWNVTQWNGID